MVMVTRSAYRKANESTKDDLSDQNIIPPWCSSGKLSERRKPRKVATPTWEIQSSYPLRENIWEHLYEDKTEQSLNCACKRNARKTRKQRAKHKSWGKTGIILCTFVFVTICMMVSLWVSNKMPKLYQLSNLLPGVKLTALLNMEDFTSVGEECCNRMKYLAAELSRAEKTLRHTLRIRRAIMLTSQIKQIDDTKVDKGYIDGASATKGRNTIEWDGRVALWGVVPLWRAARPPHTVLALRKPTPADCWPFSGSNGELIIELPRQRKVQCISVEHVRPDTTKSAPRHFIVHGILENGTWIKSTHGEYKHTGPTKQYYRIITKNTPLKKIVFSVLSNYGNPKYTCIYRIHVYGSYDDNLLL